MAPCGLTYCLLDKLWDTREVKAGSWETDIAHTGEWFRAGDWTATLIQHVRSSIKFKELRTP